MKPTVAALAVPASPMTSAEATAEAPTSVRFTEVVMAVSAFLREPEVGGCAAAAVSSGGRPDRTLGGPAAARRHAPG
ncbi:hypothetical protein Snoj_19870 [Streptomyces nojiriensis]|uniref:Uncharacterized protein n=1 Tax=Streptomyces nojiriensis TaxID=66374 RepID=A0ABQ3SIU0_9ACTN|nr:hypothetical protein GCM10010205_62180 [Streptomyces nojiriensis]GHI68069.1 hypothetical protein Snoj_19870 [Streptomyces nojiriensis]